MEGILALELKVVLIFCSLKKVHFLVSQVYFGIIYTVYFAPIRGREGALYSLGHVLHVWEAGLEYNDSH